MNQMLGYLIKQRRVEKKMSQEQLGKGFCTVSYISKIEAGMVEPSESILAEILKRLDIEYTSDTETLKEYRELFRLYFDAYFHQEESSEVEVRIYKNREKIQNSPLAMSYQLFCIYNTKDSDKKVAARLLKGVEPYKEYLNKEETFLYYMAKGRFAGARDVRVRSYQQARQIIDCSVVYEALMYEAFYSEDYMEALDYCRSGYLRAMEEGFLLVAKQISFLEGVCYGRMGQLPMMEKAYKRTKELSRGEANVIASIDYNSATAYINQNRWEEALPYLLSALKYEQDQRTTFYINHKLALCYDVVRNHTLGSVYLDMAKKQAQKMDDIHKDMVEMVSLRYNGEYEKSDEYNRIVEELYNTEGLSEDFRALFRPYMIEVLKNTRRYKDAVRLLEELN